MDGNAAAHLSTYYFNKLSILFLRRLHYLNIFNLFNIHFFKL